VLAFVGLEVMVEGKGGHRVCMEEFGIVRGKEMTRCRVRYWFIEAIRTRWRGAQVEEEGTKGKQV